MTRRLEKESGMEESARRLTADAVCEISATSKALQQDPQARDPNSRLGDAPASPGLRAELAPQATVRFNTIAYLPIAFAPERPMVTWAGEVPLLTAASPVSCTPFSAAQLPVQFSYVIATWYTS